MASGEKGGKGSRGGKCARKSPAATWKEEEEMMIARRRCGAGERGEKQAEDPGGVGCVANKGLTNSDFWKCGKQRIYGRIFGSVANKGLSRFLERGRGLLGRDEKYRLTDRH